MKPVFFFIAIVLTFSNIVAQNTYIEKLVTARGDKAGFVMYRPAKLDPAKKYPLLFVLHGIGEQGKGDLTGLKKLAAHGNYTAAEKFGAEYGFIIVEPQTCCNFQYGEFEESYQWIKDSMFSNINWKKVALTGTSLGGGGVYKYLSINPNAHLLLSAAVPNGSGGHQYFVTAANEKNVINTKVPTWAFHNRGDAVVPPAHSTLYFYDKWKTLKGSANMWVSILDLNGHTFPAYNRGSGSTLSSGLKYVVGPGYVINPAVNIYEWILMQEIGKPAVAPPVVRATILNPPINPTPVTPQPVPPTAPVTLTGFTHSSDGNLLYSVAVEIFWSNNSKELFKASSGDRIVGTYYSVQNKTVTIDYLKAPNKVVGPTKR